eukprot:NODE_2608_length_415_cov_3.139344_g2527_i0.p2 GENE.NODE_2608_length_415_cov_3.139344_g2527_i0~~NODE_2608_length_415_cov_3.139344_g2527_i0.p2  ORF type:complete len:55 (-),score=11.93 NODE_2608_length_415_cov_3.139344_g2527_i0:163-327(-)
MQKKRFFFFTAPFWHGGFFSEEVHSSTEPALAGNTAVNFGCQAELNLNLDAHWD